MTTLLDRARLEIKLGEYGVAPATALTQPDWLPRVQEYRRAAGSRMYPLCVEEISTKIPTAEYHVSRKVDGEFTVFVYHDGECFSVNPGGTVRVGLPWQTEAAQLLADAGINSVMIAGELYVHIEDRRPRVHDVTTVARQPQNADDLDRLRFAVFDVLMIDDQTPDGSFADTWQRIEEVFSGGDRIHPVEAKMAADAGEIRKLYDTWVEDEGAEGIVVRSDSGGVFKVKPKHNLDAVIIGFTESVDDRQGLLHDLLLAVMRHDGTLQVLTRVGGGFSDQQRRELLSDLKDIVVESEYAEVNSDHVAYQMVQPQLVAEISCLDLISENTRGGSISRMVLNYAQADTGRYEPVRRLPLATVISPQFVRLREDKSAHPDDVRIDQVSERVEVPLADRDARRMQLPASELLRREVYTKASKGETMVRKFVAWKTNKEEDSEDYPAYVLHYTDFSPNRKAPLARDVRVSSSLEQIHTLLDEMVADNIKKGWELHSSHAPNRPVQAPSNPESVDDDSDTSGQPNGVATRKAAKKKSTAKKAPSKKSTRKKTTKKKAT